MTVLRVTRDQAVKAVFGRSIHDATVRLLLPGICSDPAVLLRRLATARHGTARYAAGWPSPHARCTSSRGMGQGSHVQRESPERFKSQGTNYPVLWAGQGRHSCAALRCGRAWPCAAAVRGRELQLWLWAAAVCSLRLRRSLAMGCRRG